jgi:hypothetical protein
VGQSEIGGGGKRVGARGRTWGQRWRPEKQRKEQAFYVPTADLASEECVSSPGGRGWRPPAPWPPPLA